ncbi:hypothetical protein GCM10010415_57120 [Streptomyces atrovirens]|uniref:DUF397 domain-containing protein n=1 Tax=Streptomyces atrovirens TaxID=285556 RepID=A0ABW0DY23_9ACTN
MEINRRESGYGSGQGGNCVEIAEVPGSTVTVRDSKNPAGPILPLRPATFTALLTWTTTEWS